MPKNLDRIVKALKKNLNVDNPYALANWLKTSNSSSVLGQLLRGPQKTKLKASARILEAVRDTQAPEGPMMRVVLITEGLGNRVNMNYYGPEAMDSAPRIFEGRPCFLDHPGEFESRDIPERRVRDKCGYFKNVHVETMVGLKAVVGELHFDLSESGRQGYLKALTALHYKDEFPGVDDEYVGLSINADGEYEDRRVTWMGEVLDVNYVTRFTEAFSCDIVTTPARGGRFLALVESAAGAKKTKEAGTMNKKLEESLKAAQSALEEADKEQDATVKATKTAEANKLFKAFLAEAHQEAAEESKEKGGKESKEKGSMCAEEGEESKGGKKESKDKKESADDGDDDDKKKDAKESKRLAVKALALEASVDLPDEKLDQLATMTLSEAKTEISILKKMVESVAKKVVGKVAVPAAQYAKMTEAERKEAGAANNDIFADLVR
jgi:hypothetical protein